MTLYKATPQGNVPMTAEEAAEFEASRIATLAVPASVSRRQARQALALAGKLSSVEAAIAAIPDATQRQLMQIEWEDSQVFQRNRASLIQMATAIGLSSADIDALFIAAAAL